jgi:hypothetical protein
MLYRYFKFISKYFKKRYSRLKSQEGFTIVEVLVAFLIISIIAVVLVATTRTSVNIVRMNKEKTMATAIASEKIELVKAFNYDDILMSSEWPDSVEYPMLYEDGYTIIYTVTQVTEGEGEYKQVEVSVESVDMGAPVKVITQIYPLEGGDTEYVGYPPPQNLSVDYDIGLGSAREIRLIWEEPETEREIAMYKIYRDGNYIDTAPVDGILYYIDNPGYNYIYNYHVTTLYTDGEESAPSNTVTAGTEGDYPPPAGLTITGYPVVEGERAVDLVWIEPDTELIVIQYIVYRDGAEVDRTGNTYYQSVIGSENYDFYVTAQYDVEIESGPSDPVTTESDPYYPPPQNLEIIEYVQGGPNRKVNLAWGAPDTDFTIMEYVIYRDNIEVGRTSDLTYQNQIGTSNYTFSVTAIYKGGAEGEKSNEVTTTGG